MAHTMLATIFKPPPKYYDIVITCLNNAPVYSPILKSSMIYISILKAAQHVTQTFITHKTVISK